MPGPSGKSEGGPATETALTAPVLCQERGGQRRATPASAPARIIVRRSSLASPFWAKLRGVDSRRGPTAARQSEGADSIGRAGARRGLGRPPGADRISELEVRPVPEPALRIPRPHAAGGGGGTGGPSWLRLAWGKATCGRARRLAVARDARHDGDDCGGPGREAPAATRDRRGAIARGPRR